MTTGKSRPRCHNNRRWLCEKTFSTGHNRGDHNCIYSGFYTQLKILRHPRDIANNAVILGLREVQKKEPVSKTCKVKNLRNILVRIKLDKHYIFYVIDGYLKIKMITSNSLLKDILRINFLRVVSNRRQIHFKNHGETFFFLFPSSTGRPFSLYVNGDSDELDSVNT